MAGVFLFLKQCYDPNFAKSGGILNKTAILAKIFLNHNIGPSRGGAIAVCTADNASL
jgi:hypothetical protein